MQRSQQQCFKFDRYQWLKIIAINILIAIMFTLINGHNFWTNLIYSQSIGISIAAAISTPFLRNYDRRSLVFFPVIAIVLGAVVGTSFAVFVTGGYPIIHEEEGRWLLISSFICSIIIGCIVCYYFYLVAKQKETSNQLTLEQLKQTEYEQALTENNLKILQAQIEPHFLFNTLSNVIGLIDQRPDDAKKMLEHFTHYLRSSLSRTRESVTTLGDEIDIINAYLSIQKIRMEERLNYTITLDEALKDIPFPPLLIQPLVENSVRHGLESVLKGGEIRVDVKHRDNTLRIMVSDTGKGADKLQSDGIGLQNIRERLSSIFQGKAEIEIRANKPQGLTTILHIPLETT